MGTSKAFGATTGRQQKKAPAGGSLPVSPRDGLKFLFGPRLFAVPPGARRFSARNLSNCRPKPPRVCHAAVMGARGGGTF
jgi:hypothetical protein